MASGGNGGKIVFVVLVLLGVGIYWANNWSKEKTAEIVQDRKATAANYLEEEARQQMESAGGVLYQGVGIIPTANTGDRVSVKGPDGTNVHRPVLFLRLEIVNRRSDRQPVSFKRPAPATFAKDGAASLVDDSGRSYAGYEPGTWHDPASATLAYGQSCLNTLHFEQPPADVEYLDLRLPGSCVGMDGTIEVRIPGEKIRRK